MLEFKYWKLGYVYNSSSLPIKPQMLIIKTEIQHICTESLLFGSSHCAAEIIMTGEAKELAQRDRHFQQQMTLWK